MQTLAERTEALLKHVQDWPLGGAVDYLIEHGFALLDDVRIEKRGRVARLKARLKGVATEMTGEGLQDFAVRKYTDGTRVFFWWILRRPQSADGLSVGLLPRRDQVQVQRGWKVSHIYSLPEWCHVSAGEFPERSLCDLFVLLWCIARCYAHD